MAKVLRVLTIILLLLSIGALTLGTMLFTKREILKGRTQKVENALIEAMAFIEDGEPEATDNAFPARDVSDISAEIDFEPDRSDFWVDYKLQLEDTDRPSIVVDRDNLRSYFKIDPYTLKVMKDPMGNPINSGEGTTAGELKRILDGVEAQYGRLNDTRLQLQELRGELIASIDELNARKSSLREKLAHINDLNGTIEGLESDVSRLQSNVARLNEEKLDLEGQVEQQEGEIADLEEKKAEADEVIVSLKKIIEDLGKTRTASTPSRGFEGVENIIVMEPGPKGTVVSVNSKWRYCVIEINSAFIREIENMQRTMEEEQVPGVLPVVELHVKRGPTFDTYVTKVRLSQLLKDKKLAVCNIDPDWQQIPVVRGDVAFR